MILTLVWSLLVWFPNPLAAVEVRWGPCQGLCRLRRRRGMWQRWYIVWSLWAWWLWCVMVYWQCHLFRIEPETNFARLDSVRPSCSSRDGVPLIKEGSTLPLKPSFQLFFPYGCFLIEMSLVRVRLYQKLWTFKNKCQKSHWDLQILVDRRSNQFGCFFLFSPFYCRWFTETWQQGTFSSPTRMFARYRLRYYLVVIILQVVFMIVTNIWKIDMMIITMTTFRWRTLGSVATWWWTTFMREKARGGSQ